MTKLWISQYLRVCPCEHLWIWTHLGVCLYDLYAQVWVPGCESVYLSDSDACVFTGLASDKHDYKQMGWGLSVGFT